MRLALFDFDGTLTRRDTLLPFLRHTVGTAHFCTGMVAMSPTLAGYACRMIKNDRAKERMLVHFLGGMNASDLKLTGQAFARESLPALLRPDMMNVLAQHLKDSDECVLVSASLDLYVEPWGQAHGFSAVLCSQLAIDPSGQVSGRFQGENCYGRVKAARITEWLNGRVPMHITAYGDSAGDTEMLRMADVGHRV
jgi:phosphatidylglycerophosphatase C